MRPQPPLPQPEAGFDAPALLESALSVLALRLRHEVALHRALRGPSGQEGFGGLLLDGDEAERMLEVLAGRLAASGTAEPQAAIAAMEAQIARDRLAPIVEDARDRLAPVVEDARGRLAPIVEDARGRLADLTEVAATKLDERLPDDATPEAVKRASKHTSGGSKATKVLLVGGVGAGVFAVVRKLLAGGSTQPRWQSTAPTWSTSGSSGSSGSAVSRPEPMSATTGTALPSGRVSPLSSSSATDETNPSTRKLLGCTLSTHPVSGPIASV